MSNDLVVRLIDGDDLECSWRGCGGMGEYYLRRVTARGRAVAGMYCDGHERQEGDRNLAKHSRRLVIG